MSNSKLNQPVIVKTLGQIQDVEHVMAHTSTHGDALYSVVVFLDDGASIAATLATTEDLSNFADIVDSFVVGALDQKKASQFKFKIILI